MSSSSSSSASLSTLSVSTAALSSVAVPFVSSHPAKGLLLKAVSQAIQTNQKTYNQMSLFFKSTLVDAESRRVFIEIIVPTLNKIALNLFNAMKVSTIGQACLIVSENTLEAGNICQCLKLQGIFTEVETAAGKVNEALLHTLDALETP